MVDQVFEVDETGRRRARQQAVWRGHAWSPTVASPGNRSWSSSIAQLNLSGSNCVFQPSVVTSAESRDNDMPFVLCCALVPSSDSDIAA